MEEDKLVKVAEQIMDLLKKHKLTGDISVTESISINAVTNTTTVAIVNHKESNTNE